MNKVDLETPIKNCRSNGATKTSPLRDRSDISSKWNEVTSRKDNSKLEQPVNNDKEHTAEKPKLNPKTKPHKHLSCHQSKPEEQDTFEVDSDQPRSPFDLFNKIEERRTKLAKEKSTETIPIDMAPPEEDTNIAFQSDEEDSKFFVSYAQEKVKEDKVLHHEEDFAYLNPLAGTVYISSIHEATDSIAATKPPTPMTDIQELIEELVNEVDIMKHDGRTETTIHIKHSSTFSGAKVTITEFETARKELNIKFENLTQKAHEIVSMQHNRDALKTALEQKGYHVHIITANTEIEKAEHTFKGHQDRSGSDKREQQQERQQQQGQEQRQR